MSTQAQLSFAEVLRIKVMRRVWYAQLVSIFGDFLALFAVISVVSFRMHGTPAQITWVQIAYLLPIAVLSPLAGVFVDRWPIKPTLIVSDLSRAVLALLLLNATSIWHLYGVLMAISCVSSFFGPAQTVTIRSHVPREGLLSANSLMQVAFMGMRIIGPATAGAIVAALGPNICYVVDIASFVASAALISTVVISRAPHVTEPRAGVAPNRVAAIGADMATGFRFITGHRAVCFVVMAMAAGLFTVGCFGPLIAIWVRDSLHRSAAVFGVVSAMVGTGWICGIPVLRAMGRKFSNANIVLIGLVGLGVAAVLLGSLPYVAASMAATFVIGLSVSAVIVPANTLLQQETPAPLIGRVSSTSTSIVFLGQVLGLVLSGVLAEELGVRLVFFACGGIAVVLAGTGQMFLRSEAQKS